MSWLVKKKPCGEKFKTHGFEFVRSREYFYIKIFTAYSFAGYVETDIFIAIVFRRRLVGGNRVASAERLP